MGRIIHHMLLLLVAGFLGTGCSKKLERLYNDPDQLTTARVEKLFTEMLNNYRIRPSYWEMRTFVVMHSGIYSQTVGYLNTPGVYWQNPSYIESRWNDFYRPVGSGTGTMALYREMQKIHRDLPAVEKEKASLFLNAAKVIFYDQACQMVDLWGDIPFTEAGSLNASGEAKMAKFDDAADIYQEAIEQLKVLNAYFAALAPDPATANLFRTQDILLNGNLQKWQRYANALRLRLLMRISHVNETYAKAQVTELLTNTVVNPLLSEEADYNVEQEDILLAPLADNTLDLRFALTELTNYSAPQHLLEEVLLPAADPRIPVLFDKFGVSTGAGFVPNEEYRALPVKWSLEQQQVNLGKFAILDSATFIFNPHIPGILMTAAEVSFLKAEAFLRWGGGDPDMYFKLGIRQSTRFYYYLNRLNSSFKRPEPRPNPESMEAFLQQESVRLAGSAEDKYRKIATQRWVHFGFLQANQAWAELRRTGYPKLEFRVNSQPQAPLPPRRLLYPGNEVTYNVNYVAVRDKDKTYFPIFWQVR
ncbi:SusD/RagB family nutrient-binding outer membrane lipoprotein [Flavihumibacter sp. RY-1]|uniref:SusD/RagB family nutrient-binding outer membrane lipoprotein n=1 Tax=Flavihumibacter fluminis TaxID=2909236 RepID=A0ABS9BC92_9BACT|nr:SusD/RagB family nutrient-binding outer membrane lipoprotein [Flavihumibacter fluminis]MCF1713232.1 SusD/RagB family nutrient-binding outer membrane lipoprotein [Flavihumibacter fluminis]